MVEPTPVAVAVVSWNTRDLLARCLRSLRADAEAGRAEVWVFDNASDDGSPALVAADFPWVRLIASAENLGFGAGVNQVAAASRAPWIAPANADLRLEPAALSALLAAGAADARAGILAPRLILPDGSTQQSVHPFPGLLAALALNLGVAGVAPSVARRLSFDGHWDPDTGRVVPWAHGAFLLIRREAFNRAGGFDPAQFLYAEDLDLAWRVRRAGWHTRYVPAARVEHAHSAAITQLYGDARDLQAQRSAYAWLLRRRGARVMRAVALLNTLGAGTRALGLSVAAARPRRSEDIARAAWELRGHTRRHLDGLLASRERLERHR